MDYTKENGEFYQIGTSYGRLLDGQVLSTSSNVVFVEKDEYEANVPTSDLVAPKTITMRQAKLALLAKGMLTVVEGAIASMESEAVNIEWEYATIIEFDNALVAQLCTALAIDRTEFFIYASSF